MWYKEAGKGDRSRKMRQRDRQRKYKARMRRRQGGATAAPATAPSAAPSAAPARSPSVSSPSASTTRTGPKARRGGGGASMVGKQKSTTVGRGFRLNPRHAAMGAAGLAALGGGAYLYNRHRKQASIAEYSVLFDKVASGELGEHSRQALYGICQSLDAPIAAEKTASVYNAGDLSENDARKARLDQLLKR